MEDESGWRDGEGGKGPLLSPREISVDDANLEKAGFRVLIPFCCVWFLKRTNFNFLARDTKNCQTNTIQMSFTHVSLSIWAELPSFFYFFFYVALII